MDPSELLDRLRRLAHEAANDPSPAGLREIELAEGFEELDTWLVNGGFLPEQWT